MEVSATAELTDGYGPPAADVISSGFVASAPLENLITDGYGPPEGNLITKKAQEMSQETKPSYNLRYRPYRPPSVLEVMND